MFLNKLKIGFFRNVSQNLVTRENQYNILCNQLAKLTTDANVSPNPSSGDSTINKEKTISKAMKAYLERAEAHDEFMKQQNIEYQIGKRHLANMMGEDPETFTQDDINNAIEYLFPSGLFDKKARPFLRPPEEVFPQRKAAEFDASGRPHHFLFYTGKSNFYKLLYDSVTHLENLNKFEDNMIKNKNQPEPGMQYDSSGSVWLEKDPLNRKLMEEINDKEYNAFVVVMDRLIQHPYSDRLKEFVENYRKPLMSQKSAIEVAKPQYDENGVAYVTTYECLRKTARGHVTVRSPGTGKITINGEDIRYFGDVQCREQLLFPLLFSGLVKAVDVEAHVEGGGTSGQAGAIRWGIAMSLRSFLDQDTIDKMRLAGLLQRDYRTRERKKWGQAKARRKYTWKKR